MALTVHRRWLAAILNLLFLGGGVWCDCNEEGMAMEGGEYTLTGGLASGSILTYRCPQNYFPYPSQVRNCIGNGWNILLTRHKNIRQICRLVECPNPNVLEYGTVLPAEHRFFATNETTYKCDSGYRLHGSVKRFCRANGKWNGSTPICSRDNSRNDCPDPGIPAGSFRSGDTFRIDYEVTYSCNQDLAYLVGSRVRRCQENGQWTGTEPSCFYTYTFDMAEDINVEFAGAMKLSLTELASVNDTKEERRIRVTKDGILNMYIAVDISLSLDDNFVDSSKLMVESLLLRISSYSVSPNYDIVFFTSEVKSISNILDYYSGTRNIEEETLTDTIKALNAFKRDDITARGTDLSKVFHHIYEQMSHIKQRTSIDFYKHRHVILLFTDGGYNLGGSPLNNLARIKDTVFTDHDHVNKPKEREEHLDVYIFAVGPTISHQDLMLLATEAEQNRGRHYFRIHEEEMENMFDEMFEDGDVVNLCGLHKKSPKYGSRQRMYPWNVEITIQNEQGSQVCLGAIASSKFVVTAAHCLRGAYVGNIYVEVGDKNERKSIGVSRTHPHPKYNYQAKQHLGIKEFHDYDIALLQLKVDLNYTENIKPICLPCTKETTLALRQPLDSKCSDQELLLMKGYDQTLHFLTRTDQLQLKTVHAKLGQNREPCILQATTIENVTSENVHDVVTDNFLCTGGTVPFVDHIACPGESGGAVFKDYNQRTIQIGIVSWGTQRLCERRSLVLSNDISRDFHLNLFRVVDFLHTVMGNNEDPTVAPTDFIDNWNL